MSTWRESSFFPYNQIFNTDSKPEPETKIEPTMLTANNSKSAAEVKLNPPKVFSSKQTELNKFLQDVLMYLMVNKEVYNNDEKKIVYLLSFMTEGMQRHGKRNSWPAKLKRPNRMTWT